MKHRNGFVGIALLGTLIVLAAADTAEAQRRLRRGRGVDMGPRYTGYYAGMPAADGTITRYSLYPATANSAQIQLRLPSPEAEVRFDGQPTRQKGTTRLFTTPPLDGTYSYQISATWRQDGQPITRERTISVRPGAMVNVDLTTERGTPNP